MFGPSFPLDLKLCPCSSFSSSRRGILIFKRSSESNGWGLPAFNSRRAFSSSQTLVQSSESRSARNAALLLLQSGIKHNRQGYTYFNKCSPSRFFYFHGAWTTCQSNIDMAFETSPTIRANRSTISHHTGFTGYISAGHLSHPGAISVQEWCLLVTTYLWSSTFCTSLFGLYQLFTSWATFRGVFRFGFVLFRRHQSCATAGPKVEMSIKTALVCREWARDGCCQSTLGKQTTEGSQAVALKYYLWIFHTPSIQLLVIEAERL